MKGQSLKAVGILLLVFALGGLSGITISQYVDLPIGGQNEHSDRESHLPLFLKRKLTHKLDLTDEQEKQINSHLQEMTQRLDKAKKKFKPIVDNIFDSTYAKIKKGLSEEQWSQLKENRERIRRWLSRKRHKDRKHHPDWDHDKDHHKHDRDHDHDDHDDDHYGREHDGDDSPPKWQDKRDDDGRKDPSRDQDDDGTDTSHDGQGSADVAPPSACLKKRLLDALSSFWILRDTPLEALDACGIKRRLCSR